ncbi:GNAT family N-acetyltransferase [Fictibacillus phosphorivorans]|uniref:GNAT family N-acetyltransferase n=1 Tax=Fictibacillus phosphorivorans TaxID=1221500 RepID=UPI001292F319|nr:GNAT family N-acetyltransferase [Fictibacillus phosphorivorans]MQR94539.1 GNAT family N-acetyltransferase [Fictibacillus phosphorivorans]
MKIAKYKETDTEEIIKLFYETVHTVNAKDYSLLELDAWVSFHELQSKVKSWKESFLNNITFVARNLDGIVGFCNLTFSGHLDRLYVHKDYQRQGIASALVNMIESEARKLNVLSIDTDASITAKVFFEQRGYQVVSLQHVVRKGVTLINYKMTKNLCE